MSDLPTPVTREEHFLNGIAQGDTSNLPSPVGREEQYLDYIARNGGGGGGTTNYNALDNKPQIAGTTLQGDKSLADLGIASASDVTTALGGKVDKVAGKGLSTNDYDNTEKGKVADNTSAIGAIVNVTGSCNILPCPYSDSSKTTGNIQWTVNSDGSIRATGSNNSSSWRIFYLLGSDSDGVLLSKVFPCAGQYTLSCDGAVTGDYNFDIVITNAGVNEHITPSGKTYTITNEMLQNNIFLTLGIKPNLTDSIDVTFYPMLYDARLNPSGYVPYSMTNRELTDVVENVAKTEEMIGFGQCSSIGSREEFNLTKPITNYRLITLVLSFYGGWLGSHTLTPNQFRYFVTEWIRVSSGESYADIKYVNESKISVEMTNVSTQWWRIYGIV